jgi:hypothetical protein
MENLASIENIKIPCTLLSISTIPILRWECLFNLRQKTTLVDLKTG